jgi:hypothetical protein
VAVLVRLTKETTLDNLGLEVLADLMVSSQMDKQIQVLFMVLFKQESFSVAEAVEALVVAQFHSVVTEQQAEHYLAQQRVVLALNLETVLAAAAAEEKVILAQVVVVLTEELQMPLMALEQEQE